MVLTITAQFASPFGDKKDKRELAVPGGWRDQPAGATAENGLGESVTITLSNFGGEYLGSWLISFVLFCAKFANLSVSFLVSGISILTKMRPIKPIANFERSPAPHPPVPNLWPQCGQFETEFEISLPQALHGMVLSSDIVFPIFE